MPFDVLDTTRPHPKWNGHLSSGPTWTSSLGRATEGPALPGEVTYWTYTPRQASGGSRSALGRGGLLIGSTCPPIEPFYRLEKWTP